MQVALIEIPMPPGTLTQLGRVEAVAGCAMLPRNLADVGRAYQMAHVSGPVDEPVVGSVMLAKNRTHLGRVHQIAHVSGRVEGAVAGRAMLVKILTYLGRVDELAAGCAVVRGSREYASSEVEKLAMILQAQKVDSSTASAVLEESASGGYSDVTDVLQASFGAEDCPFATLSHSFAALACAFAAEDCSFAALGMLSVPVGLRRSSFALRTMVWLA